ncbi:transposase family protein [Streptomyces canus]|uniref:transposase family protein n=1 Tax=Streptomyces canus TaxID=58343 RepID=UPI0036EE42E2
MDERELSWQDVLFAGTAVLVEATVCGMGTMIVRARGSAGEVCCPSCGCPSARVHDRYHRRLQDVPLAARRVQIALEVRRFVCVNAECPQRSFAEQIPGLTSPFAPLHRPARGTAERHRAGPGRPGRSPHGRRTGHHHGANGAAGPGAGDARPVVRHPPGTGC